MSKQTSITHSKFPSFMFLQELLRPSSRSAETLVTREKGGSPQQPLNHRDLAWTASIVSSQKTKLEKAYLKVVMFCEVMALRSFVPAY